MPVAHWLNRSLDVWRREVTPDGSGGQTSSFVEQGSIKAKVDQPSAADQLEAMRADARHTHTVYVMPGADVERGDELRGDGQTFRVIATVQASTAEYTKLPVELIEPETTVEGSP